MYYGDNSTFAPTAAQPGPPGTGSNEQLFRDYFGSVGLASAETPLNGNSDYGPFITLGTGIPVGGLFTGSSGIKTPEQAAVFGGTAGAQFHACYHLSCDNLLTVNRKAMDEMSDAVAHAIFTYAFDTSSVTPPPGARAGRAASQADNGGDGHPDDHDI
jgi:Zn-dependent M28 family amino/carboxypeptidase